MGYTVFARKYRPQRFRDLVGQEHVTRTLSNAIETGRVAHAFLFTGVRGVGKTTSARILAKALNCELGPTADPCNECSACREITQGIDLDVLEIDGASNNSVEDVRRLQESIPYRPARDRHKVVIVDEVHMLSPGAFNAFLKTLEEPPAHVKFVFATTEAHRIPVTIRSRCQRYDFRLIPQATIAERIREILSEEEVEADSDTVTLVAREAAGSMRDALTLLDQIVAFSSGNLRGTEVAALLGLADHSHVRALSTACLAGEPGQALDVIAAVASQGIDLLHFARQWLDYARDVVVLAVAQDRPRLVSLTDEAREQAQTLAREHDALELQRAFATISQLVDDVGRATAPRAVLEMGAVRVATRPKLLPLAEMLAKLEQLERAPEPGPQPSIAGGRRPPPSRGSGSAGRNSQEPPPAAPERFDGASRRPPETRRSHGVPDKQSSDWQPADPHTPRRIQGAETENAQRPNSAAQASTPRLKAAELANDAAATNSGSAADDPRWRAVIARMRDDNPMWGAMYEHGVPEQIDRTKLTLAFPQGSFFGVQAQSPPARSALEAALEAVLGSVPDVEFHMVERVAGTTFAQVEAAAVDERLEEIKAKARNHPLVRQALEVFPELGQTVEIQIHE